ncbi:galactosylceramide sulfotransferase-like [Ptychodera flava]|uniref:galactosylceramide sulfotransferase-like n=1 Tax=Ptychodera flava TaxID=63121 RepID=UPI00396A1FD2
MKCLGRRRQRPLITILGVAMVLFAASEIFIRSGGIQLRRKRCSDDAEDNLPDIIQALEEHSNLQFRIRDSQAHDKAAECKPERNVAFLKVHKCGSTTVQNILLRYGEKHNLTFVLPQRSNLISYPAKFDKRDILKFPVEKYNILTHHTRFDYEAISEVMPENTTFIAIIREPTVVFESLFTYLRIPQAMKIQGPDALDKFLSNPERHISRVSTDSYVFTMKNPLLLDFGMSTWDMHDMRKVARKIKDIDSIFSLVMLSEYFDESLILLKHLLCWDLDDFTYVTLNRRGEASVRNVTEQTARRMRQWNQGDQLLYDYFNQTF